MAREGSDRTPRDGPSTCTTVVTNILRPILWARAVLENEYETDMDTDGVGGGELCHSRPTKHVHVLWVKALHSID